MLKTKKMTTTEIIREVKAIQTDVLDNKTEYNEAIEQLENFAIYLKIEFSVLYNAFYSSTPEIYFN
jgi:uncharacterized protein YgfB (UPF0149 family)